MSVIELSKEKYNTVRNLFNVDYPNLPFVFAVIEQKMPGKILVDKESDPNVCLVISGGPYYFIAGKLSKEIFAQFFFI